MDVTALPRLGYRPALDGLRGLAILGVVFRHAFHVPLGGGYGVDLFFVLSGFLITTLLLEEHEGSGTIALRAFYRRRALRLFPALVALLATFVAVDVVRALAEQQPALLTGGLRALAAAGFYTGNFAAAFHREWIDQFPLGHLWSLAEEEQFYLLWPLTLLALLRRNVGRRWIIALLWVLIAAVVAERFALWFSGARDARIYFGPDTHSDGILAGALLAVTLRQLPRLAVDRALGYFSIAALAAIAYNPTVAYAGAALIAIPASVGLVATAASQPEGFVARSLSRQPLVAIGKISYSLYLWHVLVLWTFGPDRRWAAVVISFALAAFSYRYIEQPFLRRKRANKPVAVPALAAG